MIVELHDGFRHPLRVPATRLLVRDDLGNPVAMILQMGPGHVRICDVMDEDFHRQLKAHGITDSLLVTRHDLDSQSRPKDSDR